MKAKNIIFKKVESNKVFTALQNNVDVLSELTGCIPSNSYCMELSSTVTKNGKGIIRQHPTISLVLTDFGNSTIRIAPNGTDGIEITRVLVGNGYTGKNIGSYLMHTLFLFLIETLGYIPPIFLECTGKINYGDTIVENPIQNQTKFFRKFGFRVTNKKHYPFYVRMDHNPEKSHWGFEFSDSIRIAA